MTDWNMAEAMILGVVHADVASRHPATTTHVVMPCLRIVLAILKPAIPQWGASSADLQALRENEASSSPFW